MREVVSSSLGSACIAMPLGDYLKYPAVSSSILWTLHNKSPWHAKHGKRKATEAMGRGTLLHALVLEPETVETRFHLFQGEARSEAKKREWEDAEQAGRVVVRERAWLEVEDEAERVRATPEVAQLLATAVATERVLLWTDPDTGVQCRARPDILLPDGMADIKRMSRSAHPNAFRGACWLYGSHFQAAWYMRGARILGLPCSSWRWVAVEKDGPVVVYAATALDLAAIERDVCRALARWVECESKNEWPAYPHGPLDLSSLAAGVEPDMSGLELEEDA